MVSRRASQFDSPFDFREYWSPPSSYSKANSFSTCWSTFCLKYWYENSNKSCNEEEFEMREDWDNFTRIICDSYLINAPSVFLPQGSLGLLPSCILLWFWRDLDELEFVLRRKCVQHPSWSRLWGKSWRQQ